MNKKNKFRICRITTLFVPPWSGLGPGPYEISKAETKFNNEIVVITKGNKKKCEQFDNNQDFKIIRLNVKKDLTFNLLSTIVFFKLNRKKKFDLIHSHGPSALLLILLRNLFFIKTIPRVVTTIHALRKLQLSSYIEFINKSNNFDKKIAFSSPEVNKSEYRKSIFLDQLTLKYSNAIAAVNDHIANEIMETSPNKPVCKVYNGVNPDFQFYNQTPLITESVFKIIFVGRLNLLKGELDLIEAINLIPKRINIELSFVGDGKYIEQIIESTKYLHNNIKVKFQKDIPHSELKKIYQKNNLFVLPSYSEGLPKVLLEAMSQKMIVLVSDIDAHKSIISDGVNGFTFKTADPVDLYNNILRIIDNYNGMDEIKENARRTIIENYTWEQVTVRLNKCYNELLKSN